ncbi:Receptor-type tyrosine-protein phosphatase U [Dissostichus eleginoides]|uniref:Receptor-type tyrosine-protein phosphatase U n=1 Tax=Dissostichus eleginoides TaxID=100907 RepID=A0AAD9C7Z9_DISEL|nr:Receptor-type tyrosine-protein phosphatase U [Dissostichus eleginoides]
MNTCAFLLILTVQIYADGIEGPTGHAPQPSGVFLLVIAELLGVPERQLVKQFERPLFVLAPDLVCQRRGGWDSRGEGPKRRGAYEWIEVGTNGTQSLV